MPIAGPDSHLSRKTDHRAECTPPKDPIDELIETLREEFKRGFVREQARKEAAKRKRLTILLLALAVLAGILIAAALVGIPIHPPR